MHGSKNEESEETFLIYHLIVSIPVNKKSVLIIIFFLQMKITGKKNNSYLFSYGHIRADTILNGLNIT